MQKLRNFSLTGEQQSPADLEQGQKGNSAATYIELRESRKVSIMAAKQGKLVSDPPAGWSLFLS